MKNLLVAAGVSLVFAVFFTAFLLVPMLVILISYWTMIWTAKRRTRRSKAAAEQAKAAGATAA